MNELRIKNEEYYQKKEIEYDFLENARVCENIADENFNWHVAESIHWRKRALKLREKVNGKDSYKNAKYYDIIIDCMIQNGSYKEALKWNEKTIQLKCNCNIENTLINEINSADILLRLGMHDLCILRGEKAYSMISDVKYEKNENTYDMYSVLIDFFHSYNIYAINSGEKTSDKLEICIANALEIAEQYYGSMSIEVAIIYRKKAVFIRLPKGERLKYLKKSLELALMGEKYNKLAMQIFFDIRRCWDSHERVEEGAKWVYNNVSKKFILDVLLQFSKTDQNKIKCALNL